MVTEPSRYAWRLGHDRDQPDRQLQFADAGVAKWWLPDDVLMLEELPHTATGKLNKLALRARYQDHLIENEKSGA